MGSLHKNIQLMLEFLKAVSLVLHFFLLYSFFTFFTFFFFYFLLSLSLSLSFCLSLSVYLECDQESDLWQLLELASELESDPRDTMDWGRKWLVDFSAGKNQLVSFDQSNNTGAIFVKMDGSVLKTKIIF